MIDQTQYSIIEAYLACSEAEIEQSVGRILASTEKGPELAASEENLSEIVTAYLQERYENFRKIICVEWDLDEKIKLGHFANNVELIAAIADLISPYIGAPPAAMVATLLFKRGLQHICYDDEQT